VVPPELDGSNCIDIIFARPKQDQILPSYLCLFTNSDFGKKQILDGQGGLAQQHFNVGAYKELQVPLPPLGEQECIGAILEAWEAAIAAAGKLFAAKERRLDWIRSEVLTGNVRLPGFARPWQTVPLNKVLTEHGLTSTGREEVHSVSVHHGLVNQIEHLGRSFAAANTDHYNRVLPGDIVYTKSPTGDFPLGIIKQSRLDKAAIVSPLYGVFTPASRELGTIMDALFASPAAAERLLAPVVQKGAKNTIAVTNKNFLKAQLHLPTDQREIVALSEMVEAARAELDVHQTELKLFRTQKRGLMQKLLTGQWRAPESIDALLPKAIEVAA
jgi:type I restriction enzyme S subunit